jgi:hypothetical protein
MACVNDEQVRWAAGEHISSLDPCVVLTQLGNSHAAHGSPQAVHCVGRGVGQMPPTIGGKGSYVRCSIESSLWHQHTVRMFKVEVLRGV